MSSCSHSSWTGIHISMSASFYVSSDHDCTPKFTYLIQFFRNNLQYLYISVLVGASLRLPFSSSQKYLPLNLGTRLTDKAKSMLPLVSFFNATAPVKSASLSIVVITPSPHLSVCTLQISRA